MLLCLLTWVPWIFSPDLLTLCILPDVEPHYKLERTQWVPYPRAAVFDFFSRAENLERLTPPWMHFRILTPTPIKMHPGATIAYSLRVRSIPLRWLTEIQSWNPPHEFVDLQRKGPYTLWRHTHSFAELGDGTFIRDVVEYTLPLGWVGRLVHRLQVQRDLAKIFDYRAGQVRAVFPNHTAVSP